MSRFAPFNPHKRIFSQQMVSTRDSQLVLMKTIRYSSVLNSIFLKIFLNLILKFGDHISRVEWKCCKVRRSRNRMVTKKWCFSDGTHMYSECTYVLIPWITPLQVKLTTNNSNLSKGSRGEMKPFSQVSTYCQLLADLKRRLCFLYGFGVGITFVQGYS